MAQILIIDDDFTVRKNFAEVLKSAGELFSRNYQILEAEDYDAAVEVVEINKIDLIILDLDLRDPLKTGYNFLIDHLINRGIPVVIVTAHNKTGLLYPHYNQFEIPFLNKPLVEEEFIEFLKEFHGKYYHDRVTRMYERIKLIQKGEVIKEINLRTQLKDIYISLDKIIYIKSYSKKLISGRRDSCSICVLYNKKEIECTEELGQFEDRLKSISPAFERVGDKYIINTSKIIERGIIGNRGFFQMFNDEPPLDVTFKAFDKFIRKT